MTNEQRAREWLKSWRVHYGPEAVQSLAALLDAVEREAVERGLDAISGDARLDLFAAYCRGCGRKDPRCRCWDDS